MKERAGKRSMDMTTGSPDRLLIAFAVPLLLGNLFQQLYNTVDSLVVGNFVGVEALAAVGANTVICNTLVKFFNGVSIGAGVVVSRNFGAKNDEALHESVQTTIAVTLILSVIFTVFGIWMAPRAIALMSTPPEVAPQAAVYLRIYFAGISGLLLYNMGSAIMRAVGDSRTPLFFLVLCSLLNIVLDLLFVVVLHGGIAGVAYATILSQGISAVLVLLLLTRSKESWRIEWHRLKVRLPIVKDIAVLGLPTGLQQSITAISNMMAFAYINVHGAFAMAGWSIYTKVDQFVLLPMQSLSGAATTYVSQNLGAKKTERAIHGAWRALVLSLMFTFGAIVFVWVLSPQTSRLFTDNEEVIRMGTLFLRVNLPFMMFCVTNHVMAGGLRGMGNAAGPMWNLLLTQVLCRQIYLFLITKVRPEVIFVVIGFPVGWILCTTIMSRSFLKQQKLLREAAAKEAAEES